MIELTEPAVSEVITNQALLNGQMPNWITIIFGIIDDDSSREKFRQSLKYEPSANCLRRQSLVMSYDIRNFIFW